MQKTLNHADCESSKTSNDADCLSCAAGSLIAGNPPTGGDFQNPRSRNLPPQNKRTRVFFARKLIVNARLFACFKKCLGGVLTPPKTPARSDRLGGCHVSKTRGEPRKTRGNHLLKDSQRIGKAIFLKTRKPPLQGQTSYKTARTVRLDGGPLSRKADPMCTQCLRGSATAPA